MGGRCLYLPSCLICDRDGENPPPPSPISGPAVSIITTSQVITSVEDRAWDNVVVEEMLLGSAFSHMSLEGKDGKLSERALPPCGGCVRSRHIQGKLSCRAIRAPITNCASMWRLLSRCKPPNTSATPHESSSLIYPLIFALIHHLCPTI